MGPIGDYMILVFNPSFVHRSFTVASPFPPLTLPGRACQCARWAPSSLSGNLKSEPRCRGRRSILPALEIERPSSLPLPWVSSVGLMPRCHEPGVLLGSHGASGRARAPYFKFDHDSAEMTKDERLLDDLCLRGVGAGDRSSFACRESAMIASGGEELRRRRRRTQTNKQTSRCDQRIAATHSPPRACRMAR